MWRRADLEQTSLTRLQRARTLAKRLGVMEQPAAAHQQIFALGCQLEASPDPIFLKDGMGRWLFANTAALRVFQLEEEDYEGKTDADLSACTDFYRDALLT